MAASCAFALVLAATFATLPPGGRTSSKDQLILTPAPRHAAMPQPYPLNDGREPVKIRYFDPEKAR